MFTLICIQRYPYGACCEYRKTKWASEIESGGYQFHLNEIELELVEIKRMNVLEWNKRGTNLLLHIFKLNFLFFVLCVYATSNSHLTRMVFPIA